MCCRLAGAKAVRGGGLTALRAAAHTDEYARADEPLNVRSVSHEPWRATARHATSRATASCWPLPSAPKKGMTCGPKLSMEKRVPQ